MKTLKLGIFSLLLLLIGIQSACSSTPEKDNNNVQIYTTIFAIEEFTKYIGGEHVEVVNLIPNGSDAHTFEPTAKQMVNIANADAFIYIGIGMEGFIEKMKHTLENEEVRFVKASDGITIESHEDGPSTNDHNDNDDDHQHEDEHENEHENEDEEHGHENGDPHIWLDPLLAIQLAENIKNVLTDLDPSQRNFYEENFNALKNELHLLNDEFLNVVTNANHRSFIVSHGAYGYWEKRYGLSQKAITGLSPSHEPSQKQLQQLVDYAQTNHMKYILFEQNVTPRVATILQEELQAEILMLHNLAVRSSEDNGEDYFTLMRKNIETLKIALN